MPREIPYVEYCLNRNGEKTFEILTGDEYARENVAKVVFQVGQDEGIGKVTDISGKPLYFPDVPDQLTFHFYDIPAEIGIIERTIKLGPLALLDIDTKKRNARVEVSGEMNILQLAGLVGILRAERSNQRLKINPSALGWPQHKVR